MYKNQSLRKLIVAQVLIVTFLYTAGLFIVVDREIGHLLKEVRTNILTSRLWEIGSYLGQDAEKNLTLNMPQVRTEFFEQPGVDFVIRDRNGKILFHSPANWTDYTPPETPDFSSLYEFNFTSKDGSPFVGQSGWITFDKTPYLIQVTQNKNIASEFSDALQRRFVLNVTVLAIPFMALLAFIISFFVRRSLSPIKFLSDEAQKITASVTGQRLNSPQLSIEISPLVDAFNLVLARLEAGIISQKEFVGHAAHELRTPLSILQAHISVLEDADLREKLSEDVSKMTRTVEQLLALTRLEHSEMQPMHEIDLARIVRDVCILMWPLMLKASIRLDVFGVEVPVYIKGNAESLMRAVRNLLENALNYTPKDGEVNVSVVGNEIRIRDNGPGITPEDQPYIFDRFWRKDPNQGNGTGLGLYIVKATMQLHGGKIYVETPPEGGCLFVLVFPDENAVSG